MCIFTVLFVADVRMNYDDFRSCMVATADSKTVFTPNPGNHSIYYIIMTSCKNIIQNYMCFMSLELCHLNYLSS